MSRRIMVWAAALTFGTRSALAEPVLDAGLAAGGVQIEARAHFGVATAPFDVSTLAQAKGQAFVFLAAGRYALSNPLSLELQTPLALGSVAQPAGSYVDAAALGNPQLGLRYQFLERRAGDSALALAGAVVVGAPLASHAEDLMPNRLLAIADGIEGRMHPEWFTPGVVPVTLSSALRWASAPWSLETELRLPWLVRVSEADLPRPTSNTRSAGLAAIAGLEARYRLSHRLSLATGAQFFFDLVPPVVHARDVSPVQDLERLSLYVHFASTGVLAVDLQTALAGELGGSMVAGGIRVLFHFPHSSADAAVRSTVIRLNSPRRR
jgi:hypothetical protein